RGVVHTSAKHERKITTHGAAYNPPRALRRGEQPREEPVLRGVRGGRGEHLVPGACERAARRRQQEHGPDCQPDHPPRPGRHPTGGGHAGSNRQLDSDPRGPGLAAQGVLACGHGSGFAVPEPAGILQQHQLRENHQERKRHRGAGERDPHGRHATAARERPADQQPRCLLRAGFGAPGTAPEPTRHIL
ncbi:hypothetical protein T484DRAFT_1881256, partial [Baffinella frigidus]